MYVDFIKLRKLHQGCDPAPSPRRSIAATRVTPAGKRAAESATSPRCLPMELNPQSRFLQSNPSHRPPTVAHSRTFPQSFGAVVGTLVCSFLLVLHPANLASDRPLVQSTRNLPQVVDFLSCGCGAVEHYPAFIKQPTTAIHRII